MGFLKLLLLCSDFLAWPLFALGYPLSASIKAIETGSKYEMRKLVIYWTLFSLMSLFELAFVKIIQWIPYWSCIKLVFICWLVVPRFNGACYVYESLLLPCFSLNLHAVMNESHKIKEDKPVKTDIFLDVAEEYIDENGSEALEKLIASKLERVKPDRSPSDKQVKKWEKQNAGATLEQPENKQDNSQEDKVMPTVLRPTKQRATKPNVLHLTNMAQPKLGTFVVKKSDAPAGIKEMAPSEAKGVANAAESNCPETVPPKNVQREWTCALCLVTTSSEKTFNAHLRGSRHKSNCEQSKLFKNTPKGTGSSLLMKDKANKSKAEAVKKPAGDGLLLKPGRSQEWAINRLKSAMPKHTGAAGQTSKLVCHFCQVKLGSDVDWNAHIKGRRHLSNIEKLSNAGTSQWRDGVSLCH